MCGIAGIFHPEGRINPADVASVARMTAAQLHRGPDDAGYFDNPFIALGHRRLSIIDLSAAGRQPLSNEDGTIRVVCNGEIYNFRDLRDELRAVGHGFTSVSDCEVLVHGYEEWGMDGLLLRLRGMFAFLLYDTRRQTCFAVRDRLGIKPLYYVATKDGRYGFASEVKTLLRSDLVGEARDENAVAGFLLFGSVPQPLTWRKDVRCMEPGSYIEFSRSGVRQARYWSAHERGKDATELRETLSTAIRQHLISDAPLGVFLSSGVDSTGLAALAQRAGLHPRSLTVVFDETSHNEETSAIARRYGTEHSEVRVSAVDFMREMPKILAAMDQPTADGINTFFVSKAAHEAGLKTVLSGLGADEIFRGYRHYHWLENYRRELRLFGQLPRFARSAIARLAAKGGTLAGNESWERLNILADGTPESLYFAMRGFFTPEVVARLTGRKANDILQQMPAAEEPSAGRSEFGDRGVFQAMEMHRYLHDQLLRDADVFGMAWSLEIRVPYLDHEVVECALAARPASHLRQGVNKPMLVDAIGDESVLEAARRPKTGFTFPLEKWIRQQSAELRERALKADLEPQEVKRLWKAFEEGRMNGVRAWALIVMGAMGGTQHG